VPVTPSAPFIESASRTRVRAEAGMDAEADAR